MLITALATPFKEGKIDSRSYEKLISRQKNSVDGLLAVGTTAEALLLDDCEKKLLITLAKGVAPQLPLWVGVENADTKEATKDAVTAEKLGANGILLAPPAFVKCTPKGYLLHAKQIAEAVDIPVMLYNAPSRCGYVLDRRIVEKLSESGRYLLKDAGGNLQFTEALSAKMTVLCGNDGLLSEMLARGAKGCVSVVSNVAPELTRKIISGASEEDSALFGLLAKLTMLEVNPVAVKYMLYKKGIFDAYDVRLPLTKACGATRKQIDAIDWEKIQ